MKSKVETQEMRWITAVKTGGFCFLMGFRSRTSGASIQEKDPVSKCFQVLMDSNSSQGWFYFYLLQSLILFRTSENISFGPTRLQHFCLNVSYVKTLLKATGHSSEQRGGQLRLHIWKIFLLVRSAGAGKGLPREWEATQSWRRRKLDESRAQREPWQEQELFDIVGAVSSFAGGLESCPRHFSCLMHRDVYSFPVKKDHLKEGQETKGGVLHAPWLGAQEGLRGSQVQLAQISVTPRKWIYASSTHKWCLSSC